MVIVSEPSDGAAEWLCPAGGRTALDAARPHATQATIGRQFAARPGRKQPWSPKHRAVHIGIQPTSSPLAVNSHEEDI
eukprot:scaffold1574_cov119-Isochrysis_galbana.AAC.9